MDETDIVARAWAGEEQLLRADTRHDSTVLERLLAPDFHEIGQSGRRWSRDETIAALVAGAGVVAGEDVAAAAGAEFAITERRADRLGDHAILLSYLLEFAGTRSRRSSVWVLREGELRLTFHQGTPAHLA